MENAGFGAGELLKTMKDKPALLKYAARQILCFAAGFLFARGNIFERMYPFAPAFSAAVPRDYALAAVAGGSLGYFFTVPNVLFIRYFAAMAGAAAILRVVSGFVKLREHKSVLPAVVFLCCAATGATVLLAQGFSADGILLFLCDSVIAGGAAYFFGRAMTDRPADRLNFRFSRQYLICLAVFACALLMSLGTLSFAGVSPARVLAAFAVLLGAYFLKETGGAVTGICAGVSLGLSAGAPHLAGVLALGGLLAGVFAPLGQLGVGAVFTAVNGVAAVILGSSEAVATLFEAAIATVVFVAIPSRRLSELKERYFPPAGRAERDAPRDALVMRLGTAANAIGQISSCVEAVSQGLRRMAAPELDIVFARVRESACAACPNNALCWEEQFEHSMGAFRKIGSLLREDGCFSSSDCPPALAVRCVRLRELTDNFNKHYLNYIAAADAGGRVSRYREVVSDQFQSMADILTGLACEFEGNTFFEAELAEKAAAALRESGVEVLRVSCVYDKLGRLSVTAEASGFDKDTSPSRLARDLGAVCGRELDIPAVTQEDGTTVLVFCQKASLKVRLGAVQRACEGASLCGDYFECFNDGKGREILVLSDGMGTGGRAAIDAAMAAELFSKLVKAGLSFDCALRVANSALLVKSEDESLATLDVACIDLYTGRTDFMKAGGAASFVRHKNKAAALEQASLPAGILRDIRFANASAALSAGDILLMVSDGVIFDDNTWIIEEMKNWKEGSAQQLAEHISQTAEKRRGKFREDDVTVICAMLE